MNNNLHVLVAEDDTNLGIILHEYLQAKGIESTLTRDGKSAFDTFTKGNFDLCILDVMMPVMDGFTLAKKIKSVNEKTPILFLTAKTMKEDKIEGFKIGADDYLTKPFSMEELIYRIQAIMKRVGNDSSKNKLAHEYQVGKYIFYPEQQKLILNEKPQKLTFKESELLKIMCENKNEIIDRSVALKRIWGDDSYYNSRSMDVYLTKLRKYLKEDTSIEIISIHGKGFKMMIQP